MEPFSPTLLTGKRLLVTGGGGGLGLAIARRCRDLGATVTVCGRDAAKLRAAQDAGLAAENCDIRDAAAVAALFDRIGDLDLLVNNAAANIVARTATLSPRAFDAVLATVAHGTAYVTLEAGKRWIAAGRPGTVLSITGSVAETGSAFVVPAAMGKAAVRAMTQSLAVEWGPHRIRLNCLSPGPFPTDGAWRRLFADPKWAETFETRNPLGRPGRPEELATLAAFLLSDASAFLTGQDVALDGGDRLQAGGTFNYLAAMSAAEWQALGRVR